MRAREMGAGTALCLDRGLQRMGFFFLLVLLVLIRDKWRVALQNVMLVGGGSPYRVNEERKLPMHPHKTQPAFNSLCLVRHRIHCGGRRVLAIANRPTEEQDVWFRLVNCIVDPSQRLLHADASPLCFAQQPARWHLAGDALRQNDVAVLVLVIIVLVTV